MTTTGGLSRRRVPNASGSSANDADSDNWGGSPTTPTSNGGGLSTHSSIHSLSHAGSAFEGGSKIAYDPRDLENADEDQRQGGRAPKLTIMEEVLLLGLKDKQVSCSSCYWALSVLSCAAQKRLAALVSYSSLHQRSLL